MNTDLHGFTCFITIGRFANRFIVKRASAGLLEALFRRILSVREDRLNHNREWQRRLNHGTSKKQTECIIQFRLDHI